ncbi:hypothetical protein U9M48_014534, partial [Paspalum notatum var. saurae]
MLCSRLRRAPAACDLRLMSSRRWPHLRALADQSLAQEAQDITCYFFSTEGSYRSTIPSLGQSLASGEGKNDSVVPDRTQFNNDDFPVQYDAAKFFVIKSYREDDIHMSIKYD